MATGHELVDDELNNLSDSNLYRNLLRGTLIGMPLAFVAAFIVASVAAPWPGTLVIAAWGAIVAGPFIGALAAMIHQAATENRARKQAVAPATPEVALKASQPKLA